MSVLGPVAASGCSWSLLIALVQFCADGEYGVQARLILTQKQQIADWESELVRFMMEYCLAIDRPATLERGG